MSAQDNTGRTIRSLNPQDLGRRFAKARKRQGWSQKEVARRAGISSSHRVSWIERGHCAPSLGEAVALRQVLGVDLEEVLLGKCPEGGPLERAARQLEELAPRDEVDLLVRLLKNLIHGYRSVAA